MEKAILIKYIFILLCSFYVIFKLQNLRPTKVQILLIFTSTILILAIYKLIKLLFPSLYLFGLFIPFIFASKIILKQPFKKIVPLGLTSIAISFILAIISLFIISSISSLMSLFYDFKNKIWWKYILVCLVGLFQFLLTFLIFKIKRFSRGIPDSDKFVDSDLSMFISIAIILFMSFAEIKNNENILIIAIGLLIAFLGIIMFFVWKMRFNKIYLMRQREKEVKELEDLIKDLEQKIKNISAENETMASVIHRDNKTISSFINTLNDISVQTKDYLTKEQLAIFLEYLKKEHSERLSFLEKKNNDNLPLPKTNIFSIDNILNLMKNKASEFCIAFELAINCDISYLTTNIIKETDLVTILADLIENAIIATKKCKDKKIKVEFLLEEKTYKIKISDSGIPFEPIVLENFGTKKITTHKNEGGSGIGIITLCEIVKKANASLFLEQGVDIFTKTITISFDNNSNFKISKKNSIS